MAIAMLFQAPGMNAGHYDSVMKELRLDEQPADGLLAHYAFDGPNGWTVMDVWESAGHHQQFAETRLMPVFAKLGLELPEIQPHVAELHNAHPALA
jgi:hypothetical protein